MAVEVAILVRQRGALYLKRMSLNLNRNDRPQGVLMEAEIVYLPVPTESY